MEIRYSPTTISQTHALSRVPREKAAVFHVKWLRVPQNAHSWSPAKSCRVPRLVTACSMSMPMSMRGLPTLLSTYNNSMSLACHQCVNTCQVTQHWMRSAGIQTVTTRDMYDYSQQFIDIIYNTYRRLITVPQFQH